MTLSFFVALIFTSCSKKGITPPPPAAVIPCDNRPVINARLVPIGSLSIGRTDLIAGTADNKILFAGGYAMATVGYGNTPSARVDIYDITTNTWSTAELRTDGEREGITVASVGNKILFAGGRRPLVGTATSMVDIYDAPTNTWSTADLSEARTFIAAATLGTKVYFGGGGYRDTTPPYSWVNSNVVDIYDNSTNTWSTASLSEARYGLSANTADNKIYFAGGTKDFNSTSTVSGTIDVFDRATNSWSTSRLQELKTGMASIAVGNKIFWASGSKSYSPPTLSKEVEIRDLSTGVSSFACVIPRSGFQAVIKDDNIVFFTGYGPAPSNGTHFEIYNTTTNTWLTGVVNQRIFGAAIISVNNTIYVAGGSSNTFPPYNNQVWKLEF